MECSSSITLSIEDPISGVEVAKQIHKDIDQIMRDLSIEDQETLLKEVQNIVECLRKIEQIASKAKVQV